MPSPAEMISRACTSSCLSSGGGKELDRIYIETLKRDPRGPANNALFHTAISKPDNAGNINNQE